MPPALREGGRYGFGVSESVLATEDGCEILTILQQADPEVMCGNARWSDVLQLATETKEIR